MAKEITTVKIEKTTREALSAIQESMEVDSASDAISGLIEAYGANGGSAIVAMAEVKRITDRYSLDNTEPPQVPKDEAE